MTQRSIACYPARLSLTAGLVFTLGVGFTPYYPVTADEAVPSVTSTLTLIPPTSTLMPTLPDPSQTSTVLFSPTPTPTSGGVSSTPSATYTITSTFTPTTTVSPAPTNEPTITLNPIDETPSSPTWTATTTFLPSPSETSTLSPTTTLTPSPSISATPSPTASTTHSPSPSVTQLAGPTAYPPQAVLINEVAWSGTVANAQDEWIELYNPGSEQIDLSEWVLTDGGDINIALSGLIPAYSYYLLERTDNTTIADISADKIYKGSLKNSGESLRLKDPTGKVIDSANQAGGGWPAGDPSTRASMERRGGSDTFGNWATFTGYGSVGRDVQGNPIAGTPRSLNSLFIPTPQPTLLTTPTTAPTAYESQSILINEIAWSGTLASASDEWIELHNPSSESIDLAGWTLTDGRDINLTLEGIFPAYGFLLLERGDDGTVSDIPADKIYTGGLTNNGDTLWLRDPSGTIVDSANQDGGGWPAGAASPRASMERRGGTDKAGNWGSFTGYHGIGVDADGKPIQGTPRNTNSLHFPTPVPTQIPGVVRINEVLMRPRYDWEGEGLASIADEFIELYNLGPSSVNLKGWMLDDTPRGGSKPYEIGNKTLEPGGYLVFFRSRTRIALNDRGDIVRLLGPDGQVINQIQYGKIRGYNLAYGRLPDGYGHCQHGLWPTPGRPNVLYIKEKWGLDKGDLEVLFPDICPGGGRPDARFPRAARHPTQLNWWLHSGLMICRFPDR